MIAESIRYFPRDLKLRGTTLALALVASGILALGISSRVSGLNSVLALSVAFLGTLVGWLLGSLPIRGWVAATTAAVLGGILALAAIGGLAAALIDLVGQVVGIYAAVPAVVLDNTPIDFQPLAQSLEQLVSAIVVLFARWGDWSLAWLRGRPPTDPVAALLTWTLAIWIVLVWAGWTLNRGGLTWKAYVPAGVLLSTTLAFSGAPPTALYWFLLALVPLAAMASHDMRQVRWRREGVSVRSSVRSGVALASLAIASGLVIGALITQPVSIQKLITFAQDLSDALAGRRVQVTEYLGVEQTSAQEIVDAVSLEQLRSPGLPREHLIGSGPELSRQTVMVIQTSDQDADRELLAPEETAQRFYWRSNTYDHYTGKGWRTGTTETADYQPGEMLIEGERSGHRLITQEVVAVEPLAGRVFAAGDVVTIDEAFSVEWRSSEDPFGARFETQTDRFRVASLVPQPTEDQLRSVEEQYPGWILSRYLTIPDTLSDRVLDLALELTATAPTAYDRALAIETYLRQIPYSLEVPAPPSDRELTDYFLFDLQEGYCDYYATSMVMLARASGLPARLAVGYLSGNFESTQRAYIVSEADAHSWVEIYFPEFGWVEFEPTGGRPEIARAGGTTTALSPDIEAFLDTIEFNPSEFVPRPEGTDLSLLSIVGLLLIGAGASIGLVIIGRRWRARRLPLNALALHIHRDLRDEAAGLGVHVVPGTTAAELSDALTERLDMAGELPRRLQGMRPSRFELEYLLRTYTDQVHQRPGRPVPLKKGELLRVWRRLRWQIRFQRIRFRISRDNS